MNLAHSAMKKLIVACYCMLAMQYIVVITLLIRTVDTDVVVLAVSVTHSLDSECELWPAFGTGKHFCYLSAHKITNALGPEKSQALSMFHALIGWDTLSSFVGKKTAWNTWNVLPELTDVLLQLSSTPCGIPEYVIPLSSYCMTGPIH